MNCHVSVNKESSKRQFTENSLKSKYNFRQKERLRTPQTLANSDTVISIQVQQSKASRMTHLVSEFSFASYPVGKQILLSLKKNLL